MTGQEPMQLVYIDEQALMSHEGSIRDVKQDLLKISSCYGVVGDFFSQVKLNRGACIVDVSTVQDISDKLYKYGLCTKKEFNEDPVLLESIAAYLEAPLDQTQKDGLDQVMGAIGMKYVPIIKMENVPTDPSQQPK